MNIFKYRPLALFCAVLLCVYFICSLFPFYFPEHKTEGEELAEFEVTDITFQNESIAYLDAVVASDGYKYHFTVYSPGEIRVGDVYKGLCSFKPIELSDDFDNVRYYRSKGIGAEVEVSSPEKIGVKNNILRNSVEKIRFYCVSKFDTYTEDNTSALLAALTIGDKSDLDQSIRRDFTRVGVSHMLAISGMHLSVIMSCITMFADVFNVDKRSSSIILILLCICFMFIAGMSSSVLRAGIMFIIMSVGNLLRRPCDSTTNLFTAAALIVIFSPYSVYDTGFILSLSATLGIVVIVGYYMRNSKKRKGIWQKFVQCIFISVLTSLSAQAISFIPMIIFFDSISVMTILSNLLLSPLLTLMLFAIPLFLIVSFIPFAAIGVGFIIDIITNVTVWLVSLLSSVPNTVISLNHPFFYYSLFAVVAGIILAVIIRKRYAYLMPFLCWFLVFLILFAGYGLSYGNSADFVFYSEKGSDAVIMRNRQGNVYVDLGKCSGASEERAFNVIEDQIYSNELEYWVLSHYSNDTVYTVAESIDDNFVRNICLPLPRNTVEETAAAEIEYYADNEKVKLIFYSYGKPFELNGMTLTVYAPITFEDSSVFIPSADIEYGESKISYYGLGYFDYGEFYDEYDYLYIGECGTKRKQKVSPEITAEQLIVAQNNDVACEKVTGLKTDLDGHLTIRIG